MCFTVELVREELLTNVLKYAGLAPETGRITVHLDLSHARVTLVVEDNGRQFDPVQALELDLEQPIDQPVGG